MRLGEKNKLRQVNVLRKIKRTRTQENENIAKRQLRVNMTTQLGEINQKKLVKEERLKRYEDRFKQYKQNCAFQNNERKAKVSAASTKANQQQDEKETKQFWSKIWWRKEYDGNAKWINDMQKEFEEFEEGPEANIHMESVRTTFKKVPNWKTPGHNGIYI